MIGYSENTIMTIRNIRFSKAGAVFASGELATEDIHSDQPPAFRQQMLENDADLMSRGILLQPVHYAWDQDAETFTVTRTVSSNENYLINRTWDPQLAVQYAADAGWVLEGGEVID